MTIKTDEKYMYYVENKTFELITTSELSEAKSIGLTFLDSGGSPNGWVMLSGSTIRYSCNNVSIASKSESRNVGGTFKIFKGPKRIEIKFADNLVESHNYTYSAGCDLAEQAYGFTFLSKGYPVHTYTGATFKIKSKYMTECDCE